MVFLEGEKNTQLDWGKFMKKTIFIIGFFVCSLTFAGESGFIYNGKTYTVYKDGVKVGKTIEELGFVKPKEPTNRNPSSFTNEQALQLTFQTDNKGNTCYYFQYTTGDSLSCVHK